MTKETDFELNRAANNYAAGPEVKGGAWSATAFIAGAEWARAQWPITPRTAEEAKPSDFGDAIGLMWGDLGKKLDELSIWCGALEGQANRIQRETQEAIGTLGEGMAELLQRPVVRIEPAMSAESLLAEFQSVRDQIFKAQSIGVDVGQKVEAVISLVDDLDELIRSEDDKPEEARPDIGEMMDILETDEAHRPAVGMFGIGGDASVVTPLRPVVMGVDPASPDDDATVASVRDAEGRTHPLMPPRWAGSILDVFIHNNQLYVRCERAVFVHFGGQHLIPMQFGA